MRPMQKEEDHKNENQNDDYENRNIYVEEARHAAEQNAESNSVGSYLFPPSSEEPAPPAAARSPALRNLDALSWAHS